MTKEVRHILSEPPLVHVREEGGPGSVGLSKSMKKDNGFVPFPYFPHIELIRTTKRGVLLEG